MIKDIRELYLSQNATSEALELKENASAFVDLPIKKEVRVLGELIRVDEGIKAVLSSIETTQVGTCVRCGKEIEIPLKIASGEWLYYEKAPEGFDDQNELMHIDRSKLEIDLFEAVRQEIELNLIRNPHCDPTCVEYEEPDKGVKALAGLKDLV